MKFSIVIPLYNKATYVCETIESLLAQSFNEFEVLVIDDGSTDGGGDLVAKISDPRVKLVRQSNAGVSAARNRGIAMARGEWVAFLDADDWHHPNYLACLVATQDSCPHAAAVATTFIPVSENKNSWPAPLQISRAPPKIEVITNLPARWMKGPMFLTSSIAARRQLLHRMQPCFHLNESNGEDLDLWFRLAEQTPIALAHLPLVNYRIDAQNSLSAEHQFELTMPPFIERMRARAMSNAMTAKQRKSSLWFIAQMEVSMARTSLALGNRREGLQWAIRGRHAAKSLRWWVTVGMVCFWHKEMVKQWELWRSRQNFQNIDNAPIKQLNET